jgi:hypothetical protein
LASVTIPGIHHVPDGSGLLASLDFPPDEKPRAMLPRCEEAEPNEPVDV